MLECLLKVSDGFLGLAQLVVGQTCVVERVGVIGVVCKDGLIEPEGLGVAGVGVVLGGFAEASGQRAVVHGKEGENGVNT